ncbi:MAG: NeuD/PglB/VioB family sugar acetyltransferase [Ghiorsea sp.]|nr:NeuD/PglB/VioB family sugar acetyltransferase [Ghiorsea sp.]
MPTKICLIGAGGHAKVVLDAAQLSGMTNIEVWDDDTSLLSKHLMGINIQAPIDENMRMGAVHLAIGSVESRKYLFHKLESSAYEFVTIMHPLASVAPTSRVDVGSFIAAQAVVAPESWLGKSVIVNHGAVVDHDCQVGDFSHISPNATLGGGVIIGQGCLIGAGAVILPGLEIASGVVVGAGAVVVSDVLEVGTTVKGVPAKWKK